MSETALVWLDPGYCIKAVLLLHLQQYYSRIYYFFKEMNPERDRASEIQFFILGIMILTLGVAFTILSNLGTSPLDAAGLKSKETHFAIH